MWTTQMFGIRATQPDTIRQCYTDTDAVENTVSYSVEEDHFGITQSDDIVIVSL